VRATTARITRESSEEVRNVRRENSHSALPPPRLTLDARRVAAAGTGGGGPALALLVALDWRDAADPREAH